MKVCHVTSSHSKDDARIFHNECKTLADEGYDVYIIINGAESSENKDGINIITTGFAPRNRWERWVKSLAAIKEICMKIDADIYHLHDPELLCVIPFIKTMGKKVIFDSHEDYRLLIGDKKYIPKVIRPFLKVLFTFFERNMIKKVDAAIVCYHWTKDWYDSFCDNIPIELIFNFPRIEDGKRYEAPTYDTKNICYAGNLSSQWCHQYVLEAIEELEDVKYLIAGNTDNSYCNTLKAVPGWQRVIAVGTLPLLEVEDKIYRKSFAGMALLDYISQCKGDVGNLSNTKFFEYMKAGIPLICTDFILWKNIIEKERCGICVNPHDTDAIKDAITYLNKNRDIAKKMGENGRKAVENKYNWEIESKKLIEIYKKIEKVGRYEFD